MNEGKSQYIGIVLISVLVYLLLLRVFKSDKTEAQDQEQTITEQIDSSKLTNGANTALVSEDSLIVMTSEDSLAFASAQDQALVATYGAFAAFSEGEEETLSIENELIKISFNTKGAQVATVELKEFKTFDKQALLLIDKSQLLSYDLNLASGQKVATKDLYFEVNASENAAVFSADLGNGEALEITYSLKENSYLVDYDVELKGLQKILNPEDTTINLTWNYYSIKQEQDIASEKTKSTAYWKMFEGDVEHLGIGKSKDEDVENPLNWLSYKQRFFNTSLINNLGFESAQLSTIVDSKDSSKVAEYSSSLALAYSSKESMQLYSMQFFFGPNNYKLLKDLDNDMHEVVELSADFFLFRWVKWINAWVIIPLFNLLEKAFSSYGIIIFIMTLIIKLLLMPLTFKSYVSTAKTKLLKPELDALREQYGEDQAGYAKAQMELYSKAGVSMFGGCLPMLLQMPFLLAMFYFFPSSIELRQESFLWAQDLSSFDTIPLLTFSKSIPLIGSHISIFTILMTISSLVMAKFNPQMQSQPSQPGMEMMKYMPYIFPFFLFFLFNSFPAALTYYYFLSNMITFGQQILINKFFIDEEKLHKQLEENKKKPVKKSSWASKMEEIYKQQQQIQDQQKKTKK